MKIELEIPKEFERDYNVDRFKDFFGRVLYDIKDSILCSNYEREIAEMLQKAFAESKEVDNRDSAAKEPEDTEWCKE